jgi:DNA repair protein RadC
MEQFGVRALAEVELLTILLGPTAGMHSTRDAAQQLLDAVALRRLPDDNDTSPPATTTPPHH